MIVLLAQDPVIFLSQKLYHSGLPGVCVSRNKVSVAEMHPLAPRSLKCHDTLICLMDKKEEYRRAKSFCDTHSDTRDLLGLTQDLR